MQEQYYKTTGKDGACVYGRGVWIPGKWRTVTPPLVMCLRGIHYTTKGNLVSWLNEELWLFEDGGESIDVEDKRATTRGRITERVESWNETTARLFAADCAEHVLPIFEKVCPADDRPRKAIETARQYARGEIGDAARDAAWAAARAAARAAASAAAWDAASAAAWAAAWDAAGAAAPAAARAAAGDAARDAERKWQTEALGVYL